MGTVIPGSAIGLEDRQALLEMSSARERLERILGILEAARVAPR